MEEPRYNNRQIEKMLSEQSADLKHHMSLTVAPLTVQVTKTNGTVKWLTKITYTAIGAVAVLSFFYSQDRLLLSEKSREPDPATKEEWIKEAINLIGEGQKINLQEQVSADNP